MDKKVLQQLTAGVMLGLGLVTVSADAATEVEAERLQADKVLFSKAYQLSSQGKWQKAEQIYRELSSRHKHWPEPKNNLAVVLLKTNRLDEAQKMLEQAVISSPSYRIAQKNRTQLYNYLATKAYDKALGNAQKKPVPEMALIEQIHDPVKVVEKTVEVIVEKPVIREVPVAPRPVIPPDAEVSQQQLQGVLAAQGKQDRHAISTQLQRWSKAWSQGDFTGYIGSYSERFVPSDNKKSYPEWRNIRKFRLKHSKGVRVSVDQLKVFFGEKGEYALVEFLQHYQSSTYKDKVLKQMYMQKQQDQWLILSERIIRTY